jgi:hypothetical protein
MKIKIGDKYRKEIKIEIQRPLHSFYSCQQSTYDFLLVFVLSWSWLCHTFALSSCCRYLVVVVVRVGVDIWPVLSSFLSLSYLLYWPLSYRCHVLFLSCCLVVVLSLSRRCLVVVLSFCLTLPDCLCLN